MKCVFPYPGGKTYMASWIVNHFADHECYVEPFGGGASVLVNKRKSKVEVYNDKDEDVVHFFKTLRDKPHELIRWVKQRPYHKDLHDEYGKLYFNGYRPTDDVERAGRFFYLRMSQFVAKYNGFSGFSSSNKRPQGSNKTLRSAAKDLGEFADRFASITIENRDWRDIFDRFDGPDVLFYCDPPYVKEGSDLYSNNGFDHEGFCQELSELSGRWIVSYTDLPNALEGEYIVEKEEAQHMRKGQDGMKRKTRTERLVMNYNPNHTPMASKPKQETLGD